MSYDDDYLNSGLGNNSFDDAFGYEDPFNTEKSDGSDVKHPRKKKGGAGKVILIVVAVVVALLLAVTLIRSPGRRACKELISELQADANNKNIKGIVNLLVPKYSLPLNGLILVGEMATDADLNEAFTTIMSYISSGSSSEITIDSTNVSEMMGSIEIKPINYGLPASTRKVKCRATFFLNGVELRQYVYIYIQKIQGDCYLKKIRLALK